MEWVKLLLCDIVFDRVWTHNLLLRLKPKISRNIIKSVEDIDSSTLGILLGRYFNHFLCPFFEVHTIYVQSLLRKTDIIILVNLFCLRILRAVLQVFSFDLT